MKKLKIIFALGVAASAIVLVTNTHFFDWSRETLEQNSQAVLERMSLQDTQAPKANWFANDTTTGNLLAANFAKSQRDWVAANDFTNRLEANAIKDDDATLRLMLLALSAGDFKAAANYAEGVHAKRASAPKLAASPSAGLGDGRDFAELILAVQALSFSDASKAEALLADVQSPALKTFLSPLLLTWIEASLKKPITGIRIDHSLITLIHVAQAAEWHGEKAISDKVFTEIAGANVTRDAAMMAVYYFIRNNDMDAAKKALQHTLTLYPQDADAAEFLKTIEAGRVPEVPAYASFHMQGLTAGAGLIFRDLAQIMQADGATDSAILFAQMGRMVRPDTPGLAMLLAHIFTSQGRNDEAAALYKAVPDTDMNYLPARIALAELLQSEKKNDDAIALLTEIQPEKQNADILMTIGEMYRSSKNYEQAIVYYNKAAEAAGPKLPSNLWPLLFYRAMAYDAQDNWTKAEIDLKAALALRPNNPHVLNYLAYSWADKGINLPEAEKMIRVALLSSPNDAYVTDSMGWVYYRMGQFDKALTYLERAIALKPYDPVINDHLGDAYLKVGRTLEAQYQWLRALDFADKVDDQKLIDEIRAKMEVN